MNLPYPGFEVEFTKKGVLFDPAQEAALKQGIQDGGITDLFVVSHGWNNDVADATRLYEELFASVAAVKDAGLVADPVQRKPAVLAVFWPSKKFTDDELIPGGGAALAGPHEAALRAVLEKLKVDPERLGGTEVEAGRAASIQKAQDLIAKLAGDPKARRDFVLALREVMDKKSAHADDGSDAFFDVEPQTLFQDLDAGVIAPAATGGGGGAAVGGGGGAAGLKDALSGALGAARRLANFATYYQMKERAGTVGSKGLVEVLKRVRASFPEIRLHLIGHSFGGRVVTAAAAGLDPQTPRVTVTLLQAAYSHNGLATKFDGQHDGFFRKVVSEKRVSGPIVITHTKNDKAVGIAYPLASRIAHEKAAALGDANDPYGGMGRNGAQKTAEVDQAKGRLLDLGEVGATPYAFQPGKIYNLNSDHLIKDHSDIRKNEVAAALWSAVAACK